MLSALFRANRENGKSTSTCIASLRGHPNGGYTCINTLQYERSRIQSHLRVCELSQTKKKKQAFVLQGCLVLVMSTVQNSNLEFVKVSYL